MRELNIQSEASKLGSRLFMTRPRHCKIVGTLGPSSSDETVIRALIEAGLDIVRLNFSHGTHDTHFRNIETVRRVAREAGRQVAILQDLQGPKIRCGKILNGAATIVAGNTYRLQFGTEQKTEEIIPVDFREFVHDIKVGQRVLMDDGLLVFEVVKLDDTGAMVLAKENGTLKSRKGVNFPDARLSLPSMTEKDSRDLLFGIAHHVDYVALSFVQRAEDVKQLKAMIRALGADVPVIAKIEKLSAIEEIEAIATAADGLMVARGDLGVEGDIECVPSLQRRIIEAATTIGRPVIIATQMLESMIDNPRPTPAEVADVANGVLEGADCVMLSGEVASGKYPVQCVERMAAIISEVENWTFRRPVRHASQRSEKNRTWEDHEAIARAACEAADALSAKAIVCLTLTGSIARSIAQWRPKTPIVAISPRRDVVQRLTLLWGVYGIPNPLFFNTDMLLQDLPKMLKDLGLAHSGDTVVITAGIPINQMRSTNMIKINRIP